MDGSALHRSARDGDGAGILAELAGGVPVDVRDPPSGRTPLMAAVAAAGPLDGVRLLVSAGADVSATVSGPTADERRTDAALAAIGPADLPDEARAVFEQYGAELRPPLADPAEVRETPLSLVVGTGRFDVIAFLVGAGADVRYVRGRGYDVLIDALHGHDVRADADLIRTVELLVAHGARLNTVTPYGESALSVATNNGRFDVAAALLAAGADPAPLAWSPLHRAVALGTADDVRAELAGGADLAARDRWERTPWLLGVAVGNVEKVRLLLAAGSDRRDRGRCGKPPLAYAAEADDAVMLRSLLAAGFDPDQPSDSGETAVMAAVERGHLDAVGVLVAAGAKADRDWQDTALIRNAPSVAMARLLVSVAGADLTDVNDAVRRTIAHLPPAGELRTMAADYLAGRRRRFGTANPERDDDPFRRAMVDAGVNAHVPRSQFGSRFPGEPIWCHDRFGRTTTELGDGRVLQIAGEHEDSYDPDFCIYNDVTVHHPDGRFELFAYPAEVFPPTDFHTATVVGRWLYLIGNLGYPADRRPGRTPVFRLDVLTLAIEPVDTAGDGPGWISRHRAVVDGSTIWVSGGQIWTGTDLVANAVRFSLDVGSRIWSRLA